MFRLTPLLLLAGLAHAAGLPLGHVAPETRLTDANTASASHNSVVRPSADHGAVSLWYFLGDGDRFATQIDALQAVQTKLRRAGLPVHVRIVVPDALSARVGAMGDTRMPMLVDSKDAARAAWGAADGDLVILDLDGRVRDQMSLATDDLHDRFVAADLQSRIETLTYDLGSAKDAEARNPLAMAR